MPSFEGVIYSNSEGEGKIQNSIQMRAFFKKYPDSQFTIEIKKMAERKSSKMRGYYFAAIVPVYQQCLRANGYSFSKDQTHDYIKQFSAIMVQDIEIGGVHSQRLRSFKDDDWTDEDMKQYIEDLIIFAAEHFSVQISDPI